VGPGLQLVWREPPVWPEPPPAEPMPAAERTKAPTSQRQKTHREKIVSLKMLACGYRLDADSRKVPRRSIIEVPASCPAKAVKCPALARRKRSLSDLQGLKRVSGYALDNTKAFRHTLRV
jgi:hypothetical protein